ncbi:ABC transporter substrate-binding protein, partial [Rhizobium johnstonii]
LDTLREQSNVGQLIFNSSLWESLIGLDWLGNLSSVPSLATEWRRIDDNTVELKLRQGVKFHNGDEMTAEDSLAGDRLRIAEHPFLDEGEGDVFG